MTGPSSARASDRPTAPGIPPADVSEAPTGAGSGAGPVASAESGARSAALPRACPSCKHRYPADFKVCPRDASPLVAAPDEADPLIGSTLGDAYQILRIVGEGGMGRVYEARHTRLGNKRFAVKMLRAEYAGSPDIVARFQREAQAASGIGHPNVVDVYDVHHTDDGRPYLVGEFLEGEELGEFLQRAGKISVSLAVRIARQVCRALGAAHARGVVHRDMKPENVFLVGSLDDPQVKVIDFGISKVGDAGGAALTRTGMIMGTPSYMAPEQARGERIDLRADVYAVGGILYRSLTGRKPFDSDDPSATLTLVLTRDPERPRALEPSIPEALELVIQKAMAKDPAERYGSMAELEAELVPFDPTSRAGDAGASPTLLSGARDTLEGAAETLVAGGAPASSATHLLRTTREASRARPMIALLTLLAYGWILAGLVDALAGVLRLSRGPAGAITKPECVLITTGAIAATLTPLALWVRHVARGWGNTLRAVQLAFGMRRVMTASVAASGAGALLVRLFYGMIRQDAQEIAWAAWSPLLFAASLAGAVLASASLRLERRKKTRALPRPESA